MDDEAPSGVFHGRPPSPTALPTIDPPDIMNDPAFDPRPLPPRRSDTATTDGGKSDRHQDTCRICRSEASASEPLFHPCKCSGSIKYVHQDCLMEWLSHSNKKHCELCKTPFHFTKLYDSSMPSVLPLDVFVTRASMHVSWGVLRWFRIMVVALVWLVVLPWTVRLCWRWMFWFADAGWAREMFISKLRVGELLPDGHTPEEQTRLNIREAMDWVRGLKELGANGTHNRTWNGMSLDGHGLKIAASIVDGAYNFSVGLDSNSTLINATSISYGFANQAGTSLFSDWNYIANMTGSPHLNRAIVDVFEGQIITAVIIIGFILVFLIREWVVQQQPLINLENAADRINAEHDRLQRQRDLLDAARERVQDFQQALTLGDTASPSADGYVGWDQLDAAMDRANAHLLRDGRTQQILFVTHVTFVCKQVIAARRAGEPSNELAAKLSKKLSTFDESHRKVWRVALAAGIDYTWQDLLNKREADTFRHASVVKFPSNREGWQSHVGQRAAENSDSGSSADESSAQRPQIDRSLTSRAADIQRTLQESEQGFPSRSESRTRTGLSSTPQSSWETLPSQHGHREEAKSHLQAVVENYLQSSFTNSHEWIEEPERLGEPLPIINAGSDMKLKLKIRRRDDNVDPSQQAPLVLRVPKPNDDEQVDTDAAILQSIERIPTDALSVPSRSASFPGLDQHLPEETLTAVDSEPETVPGLTPMDGSPVPVTSGENLETHQTDGLLVHSPTGPEIPSDITPETNGETANQTALPERAVRSSPTPSKGAIEWLMDWFWGDLAPNSASSLATNIVQPAVSNDRVAADNNPRQHAEVDGSRNFENNDGEPRLAVPDVVNAPPENGEPIPIQDNMPEGGDEPDFPDAEALEDDEDLEGIVELIGLQGPMAGLLQTATFCTVLVTATIIGAVGLPYIWGKIVLSFVGAPWRWLVTTPLLTLSWIADGAVDLTLLIGGTIAIAASNIAHSILFVAGIALPRICELLGVSAASNTVETVLKASHATTQASLTRLLSSFVANGVDGNPSPIGWNWAILGAHVQAHQSLREIENDLRAVLRFASEALSEMTGFLSTGTVGALGEEVGDFAKGSFGLPAQAKALVDGLAWYLGFLKDLPAIVKAHGLTLTLSQSRQPFDPDLINWSTNERTVTVALGYLALSILAAIYVAIDTPLTSSESGRRFEKQIRDNIRHAGGVCKVIVIISIEMLVFPLYCGMLLDIAFLPLFSGATVATRVAYAGKAPATFCFMHWITGTAYMFHFALFVGMCRKILRKGVLWFIRDPDDPTFHPVRDVLERNILTQLRKIGYSAMIYGGLVILCLGGFVWGIAYGFKGVFPLVWVTTEPTIEFPMDLLVINVLTPLVIRSLRPNDILQEVYDWWLKKSARALRMSHFLFDKRYNDEEGHFTKLSFKRLFSFGTDSRPAGQDENSKDSFVHDGRYAMTPSNDQYRPPKVGEAYLQATFPGSEQGGSSTHEVRNVRITDKSGNDHPNFTAVYVPPYFRYRVAAYLVLLWLFTAFLGLSATLVPLVLGRWVLSVTIPAGSGQVNDLYAFLVGAYIFGGCAFAAWKYRQATQAMKDKVQAVKRTRFSISPAKRIAGQVVKCVYVYGIMGLVFPFMLALMIHFYTIIPVHTYAAGLTEQWSSRNTTTSKAMEPSGIFGSLHDTVLNTTTLLSPVQQASLVSDHKTVDHGVHLLQDLALGLLYVRIASRIGMASPSSRAVEAFRRTTRAYAPTGLASYLNPNPRLATRYFFLPALLLSLILLLTPVATMKFAIETAILLSSGAFDPSAAVRTRLYRYSYPMCAAAALVVWSGMEITRIASKWRMSIRDEVYLVGERLHNFGESRPPAGSKSFTRKNHV